jgi:hypothetical protein
MLDALRICVLAALSAGMLAAACGRAAAADGSADPAPPALERAAGAEIDALLDPWRRIRVAHLIPDHAHACLPAAISGAATPAQRAIATSLQVVAESPLGAWLIDRAAARTVLICHDPNTTLAAYYRSRVRLIGVLTRLPDPAKVMFLAHELAHVLQHPLFSNDRRFGPAAMLLMHRVREATAEAIATRVLWQLRARGSGAFWDYKTASAYGDIAHAFAEAMDDRSGEAAELWATRAAFDQWFEEGRRLERYDDHMLDHIEPVVRERSAQLRQSRSLTDAFLRGIGAYGGATFLPAGSGPPLTDPRYAGRMSADNAARLETLLKLITRPAEASLETTRASR